MKATGRKLLLPWRKVLLACLESPSWESSWSIRLKLSSLTSEWECPIRSSKLKWFRLLHLNSKQGKSSLLPSTVSTSPMAVPSRSGTMMEKPSYHSDPSMPTPPSIWQKYNSIDAFFTSRESLKSSTALSTSGCPSNVNLITISPSNSIRPLLEGKQGISGKIMLLLVWL